MAILSLQTGLARRFPAEDGQEIDCFESSNFVDHLEVIV
jgi:hypothetical protein